MQKCCTWLNPTCFFLKVFCAWQVWLIQAHSQKLWEEWGRCSFHTANKIGNGKNLLVMGELPQGSRKGTGPGSFYPLLPSIFIILLINFNVMVFYLLLSKKRLIYFPR